jgi:hypothetical protein
MVLSDRTLTGSATTNHAIRSSSNTTKYSKRRKLFSVSYPVLLMSIIVLFTIGLFIRNNVSLLYHSSSSLPDGTSSLEVHTIMNGMIANNLDQNNRKTKGVSGRTLLDGVGTSLSTHEDVVFDTIEQRAMAHQRHCDRLGLDHDEDFVQLRTNNHTAHLPQFGIINAIRSYRQSKSTTTTTTKTRKDTHHVQYGTDDYPYRCQIPPENECDETSFTVVFMAYNPDRLEKMFAQIQKMLTGPDFATIVKEVIIVWNGERAVEETAMGKQVVEFGTKYPLRISYPLKAGFPNDLMNRYHPRLMVQTKAIMYYDDDGPFYSYSATLGGFELWKRNSNAQVGAMARRLELGPRQTDESRATLNGPGDRFFISQCPTDELDYNYRIFATFGARMVLPSGSFLHTNYLCFLWHPVFDEIRQYVKAHPVNPDDGTVSAIVSQLAGRAPKTYSRRIGAADDNTGGLPDTSLDGTKRMHGRRLMDGINWDTAGGHDKKMNWGQLRSDVANSLARYFGSTNSGSLGWCYGTEFHKGENCKPEMAKFGQLPWMKEDHTPRDTCP